MTFNIGDIVPITLQVADGKEGLKVIANIIDPAGLQLDTVELTEVRGGLYANLDYKMPPYKFIVAQYVVLNTDDYELATDTFYGLVEEAKELVLSGQVLDIKSDEALEGLAHEVSNH